MTVALSVSLRGSTPVGVPVDIVARYTGSEGRKSFASGEVVVDYAIRLQKELGGAGKPLWVAAYANDVVGYIPSVRVLKEGGYEAGESFYGSTWPTPLADDIESIVVKAAHQVVERVRQK